MLTEKDYCDYDTCVALKELGYIGSSRYYYTQLDRKFHYDAYNMSYTIRTANAMGYVLAIHLYDAQKWLRENYGIHIIIDRFGKNYNWFIKEKDSIVYDYESGIYEDYIDYESALLAGIKKVIEILKEVLAMRKINVNRDLEE